MKQFLHFDEDLTLEVRNGAAPFTIFAPKVAFRVHYTIGIRDLREPAIAPASIEPTAASLRTAVMFDASNGRQWGVPAEQDITPWVTAELWSRWREAIADHLNSIPPEDRED